jgi:hypothetical protein
MWRNYQLLDTLMWRHYQFLNTQNIQQFYFKYTTKPPYSKINYNFDVSGDLTFN